MSFFQIFFAELFPPKMVATVGRFLLAGSIAGVFFVFSMQYTLALLMNCLGLGASWIFDEETMPWVLLVVLLTFAISIYSANGLILFLRNYVFVKWKSKALSL